MGCCNGDSLNDNNNPVVVISGIVDITLLPNQQLVTPGTIQVYPNAEAAQAFPAAKAVSQTVLSIPKHTPGAN